MDLVGLTGEYGGGTWGTCPVAGVAGGRAFFGAFLRRQQQQMIIPTSIARTKAPPIPADRPIIKERWRSTHELPFWLSDRHLPLRQSPSEHGVPSCTWRFMPIQTPDPYQSTEQLRVQESLLHEDTPVLFVFSSCWHCISRLVHSPLAQKRPDELPHVCPSGAYLLVGQELEFPAHVS